MDNFIKTLQQFCLDLKAWEIDKKSVRFFVLFLAAVIGVIFGIGFNCISGLFICYLGFSQEVVNSLTIVVIGIFVFIALWYFRTRDVRQQIEKTQEQISKAQEQLDKTQEQIHQVHYNNAVENLTSNTRVKVEIGTYLLIKLHDLKPDFKESIKIAFIERLKFYAFKGQKIEDIKIAYGRNILMWLFKNREIREVFRLQGADLSNQDLSSIIFKNVDLTKANFENTDLTDAIFEKSAIIIKVDFSKTIITDVNFTLADIRDTIFDFKSVRNAIFTEEQHKYIYKKEKEKERLDEIGL